MRVSRGVNGLLLVALGVILGWWLSNRPFGQMDEAFENRIETFERSISGSVPLWAVILAAVLIILLVKD